MAHFRVLNAVAAAIAAGIAACNEPASTNGPMSAVPAGTPVSCTPPGSVSSAPTNDPNGPYGHQVVIARTTDGLTLTGARQVLDHASVPDGVRLPDGSVLVYYVNGAAGGATWVARIEADTARVLGPITIDGIRAPIGVVDPDAFPLGDGRVRLSYLSGFGNPSQTPRRAMCTADSNDGVSFTSRGPAFWWINGEQYTDPSLLRLADGSWLMAISLGQQTIILRSADGLTFTRDVTHSFGGIPELALAPDGAVRLYVCAAGITAYRSTDAGRTFLREQVVIGPGFNGRNIVCDPSLVAGAGMFVFKTG